MAFIAGLAAAMLGVTPIPLTFVQHTHIDGEIVMLADVADISGLPEALHQRARSLPVARVRSDEQHLSSSALAARARRAVPALSEWLPDAPGQVVRVSRNRTDAPQLHTRRTAQAETLAVMAGDPLSVSIRVGPVVIERDVEALQAGRHGRPVFVRTAEGRVLVANLEAAP